MLKTRRSYRITVLIILCILLVVSFLLSLRFGAYKVTTLEVIKALFIEKEGLTRSIIYGIRLPRTIVAGLCGLCLSISGAILQGVMKNSLASPNLIGISSGAGLGATICLVLFPSIEYLITPVAFIFALSTSIIIYLLSYKDGIKPLRIVLAGIAVSSLISALINMILIFFPDRVADTLGFTIGSLAVKTFSDVYLVLPYAVVGLVLVSALSFKLNILMLGDEVANSLGLRVELFRLIMIAVAALLAASAVSVAGLIGFVGLLGPHLVRMLIGSDYRYLIPGAAIFGSTLVISCDTVARVAFAPMELPVGIILALLGVPLFLYLLRGGNKLVKD